jgi:hypothetical protein
MSSFASAELLIIVHPGATCAAADQNLGTEMAEICRQDLVDTLHNWSSGIFVLDCDRSDELERFPALHEALLTALQRARSAKQTVFRRLAEGQTVMAVVREIFDDREAPRTLAITLTGAWYEQSNDGGAVNRVEEVLRGLGYTDVSIDHSAFEIDYTAMDMVG